jgi:predicted DNA-binding transcriptional regulator AlpA
MRTKAAAAYVGYAESTFEKKRVTGDGPPFIKLGRRGSVVYDTRDLDTWLAARRVGSTSAEVEAESVYCPPQRPDVPVGSRRHRHSAETSARSE